MSISTGLPRSAKGSFDSFSVLPAVTIAAASAPLQVAESAFPSWYNRPLLLVKYNDPLVPKINSEAPS